MKRLVVVGALALAACATLPPPADLTITNALILDGSGAKAFEGAVSVKGGKIVAVGAPLPALRVIDARGLTLAPGFIDVHTHIELGLFNRPTADNYVMGGVTTVVTGNCGGSADSVHEFLVRVDREGTSINVATLVGHNTVRRQVMGLANRKPTAEEQAAMEALVAREMRAGAVGLSTGLIYLPGIYSETAEVLGLARVAAREGGLYASHIRNEGGKVAEAINEALDIGRGAGLPVQVSHFKVSAPANWGRSKETLAMIEAARAAGQDVMIDQYPYTASSTNLFVMLPDWAMEGGAAAIKALLSDPAKRAGIAAEMLESARKNQRPSFAYAVVSRHAADPSLNGRDISRINRERGRPATLADEIETMLDLMVAGGAQMVYHGMHEDDVRAILAYPHNMVGGDGGVQDGRGQPHPRSYGTHARVLGKYVREEKLIPLEDAVRRMTSLPAARFRLAGRGLVREGYAADLVLFDPATIADRATFDDPHQYSAGIRAVVVNGALVVDEGRHTGVKSGAGLRAGR